MRRVTVGRHARASAPAHDRGAFLGGDRREKLPQLPVVGVDLQLAPAPGDRPATPVTRWYPAAGIAPQYEAQCEPGKRASTLTRSGHLSTRALGSLTAAPTPPPASLPSPFEGRMADRSGIEWTEATWNPVTGCSKVSPGCAHGYAEALSLRFGWSRRPWLPANEVENVILHPERLEQPSRWRRPRLVFVNSMSGTPTTRTRSSFARAVSSRGGGVSSRSALWWKSDNGRGRFVVRGTRTE